MREDNAFPAVMGRVLLRGHRVTIRDAGPRAGGMMRFGIPTHRLPRDVLDGASRTANRLGAEEALIVHRRTRERMPVHDLEVEEALEEGVLMKWLSTIERADGGKLVLERMELDQTGFRQPTGELEGLERDSGVQAPGQEADLSLLDGVDGIGHGTQAARCIDARLGGKECRHRPRPEVAAFDQLDRSHSADAPRTVRPRLGAIRRRSTFEEVTGGLDEETAKFEARRCTSCGNRFVCDNGYGVSPDDAVVKLDQPGPYPYVIDLDFCKGCGLCAAGCPCGAIHMQPETI